MRLLLLLTTALVLTGCDVVQKRHPAAESSPASVTIIGEVDDPEAVRAYLAKVEKSEPLRAVAARSVDGGPAHPRLTFVYMTDRCGSGGCSLHILERSNEGLRELSRTSITRAPIRTLESNTNGMPDLAVKVCGGGIIECYEARLRFNGATYASNPTVPPAEPTRGQPPGRVVIAEEDVAAAFRLNARPAA